jgi:hypothetical protein
VLFVIFFCVFYVKTIRYLILLFINI